MTLYYPKVQVLEIITFTEVWKEDCCQLPHQGNPEVWQRLLQQDQQLWHSDQSQRHPDQEAPILLGVCAVCQDLKVFTSHSLYYQHNLLPECASVHHMDEHWTPVSVHCAPCMFDYNVIVHVEKLADGEADMLRKMIAPEYNRTEEKRLNPNRAGMGSRVQTCN